MLLLAFGGIALLCTIPLFERSLVKQLPEITRGFFKTTIIILIFCIYGIMCIFVLRRVYYRLLTGGRRYGRDYQRYRRGYFELLEYFREADPYQINENELPRETWEQTEGVILGKKGKYLIKRDSASVGNLATFGLPGCGKTTGQIIPTALRFDGSVLAIDIKGDILHFSKNQRKIKIFNPEDPINSCHFDPFEGITAYPVHEKKICLDQMSLILVQDENDSSGKYFAEGGRNYFCGITLYMMDENPHTTFPEVVSAILHGNAMEWVETIVDSDCSEAQEYLASYLGTNEKNVSGCYNTICKALLPFGSGPLEKLLNSRGENISVASLEQGYDIYIEIPQDKIKIYAPVTTLIVQNFMNGFMRRKDISGGEKLRPVLFLLDEFPQLRFEFDTLSAALSTLRSKGVTLFLAQQSIAQLEKRYGETGCREIIDTCAYLSIFSAQDPKSREFFQKLIGTRKVLKVSNSENAKDISRNIQETREPIFQPEDFGNLIDQLIIYVNGRYIKAEKIKCYEKSA